MVKAGWLAVLLVVVAGLLVLSESEAQQSNDANAYCNVLARLSETAAEARDRGVPINAVGAVVSQIADPRQRSDAITVIQLAYTEPYLSPELEAGIAFEICWATYGGE